MQHTSACLYMFQGIIQASVQVDEVAVVQPQKRSLSFSLLCLFAWPKSLDLLLPGCYREAQECTY